MQTSFLPSRNKIRLDVTKGLYNYFAQGYFHVYFADPARLVNAEEY